MEYVPLGREGWRQIKKGRFTTKLNKNQINYAERVVAAAERQGSVTSEAIGALFVDCNSDRLSEAERYYALNVIALCWKYGEAIKDFLITEVKMGRLYGITESGGAFQIWTAYG